MKKHNKVSGEYIASTRSKSAFAADVGIKPPRHGTNSIFPAASLSGGKEPVDTTKYRGFKNYDTWELAATIQNNEGLHDMCRCLFEDGYKSYGAMRCKLIEFGPRWKADHMTTINWNNDNICAKEITRVLVDLFAPKPKTKTKK
jgi:hypothetical protein